jgi:stearoyl-CoA desaturase (delta-9 desaturase)
MRNDAVIGVRARGFNPGVTAFIVAFHILAVAGFWYFTWQALIAGIVMWWVAGSLGIGIAYHRLLTHRGFRVPKPLEYFLTLCGSLALEGGPIAWVATHRVHHVYTDRDGDPHSPKDGVWWSHIGWIINGQALHSNTAVTARHAADLAKDRFHVLLTRFHFVPQILVGFGLYYLGGWPFVFWGVFVRVVFSWHATWLVNSAAHIWGSKRFATRDDSRNNWWVALLAFGEGWHNNHHAHPSSARHGLAWYEVDVNWYGIRLLEMLGLVKAIRVAELPGKTDSDRDSDDLANAA